MTASGWLAIDPSKRSAEKFYLISTPATLIVFLVGVINSGYYRYCNRDSYLIIALLMASTTALPGILPASVLPTHEKISGKNSELKSKEVPFWMKAFVWNAIFGFVGNYLWTHYFYTVLGASYTFDSYQLNQVPLPCYLATQCYFCFYHTVTSAILRKFKHLVSKYTSSAPAQLIAFSCLVCFLAYMTAVFEVVTISAFPHYSFKDSWRMYTIGSAFYGIYFIVSFPMFLRIDEDPQKAKWTLAETALDAFAAAMIVTLLLDFWRLTLGSIIPGNSTDIGQSIIPFIQL
mmetsp:Transcript_5835/g.10324  ORF Transcript_5835/g.10324 Transcript_5835/m.10324 type:complete len:289 (-) Transcript_5835:3928-4794(-)